MGDDGTHTTRIAFRVPVSTYQSVFERTTRGLYFFNMGRILPATAPISVTMLAGTPGMETDEIRILNMETIGDGALVYRYGTASEDVDCSLWIYEFHHAHWTMVTTGSVE